MKWRKEYSEFAYWLFQKHPEVFDKYHDLWLEAEE